MVTILGDFLPLLGVFIIVAGIIYLSYIFSRYIGMSAFKARNSKYMKIIDQIAVGQDKSMAIIQIGGQYYLLGITSSNIQKIAQIPPEEILLIKEDGSQKPPAGLNFKEILSRKKMKK